MERERTNGGTSGMGSQERRGATGREEPAQGAMSVLIKEADPFTRVLIGFGRIPTAW